MKMRRIRENLRLLGDIESIMTAMKNLSSIELIKLAKFLSAGETAMETMETAAADLLGWFPKLREIIGSVPAEIAVIVGSEKGFCGNFNDSILQKLAELRSGPWKHCPKLITIGRKLGGKLDSDPDLLETLEGPSVAEEVSDIVHQVTNAVRSAIRSNGRAFSWAVIYNQMTSHGFHTVVEYPLNKLSESEVKLHPYPPVTNLPGRPLFSQLIDEYLFGALHQIFYRSLRAENQRRLQHMGGAIDLLEKKREKMVRLMNRMRQETITEEIEVMLLSAEAASDGGLIATGEKILSTTDGDNQQFLLN